jgi:hypothetical protein
MGGINQDRLRGERARAKGGAKQILYILHEQLLIFKIFKLQNAKAKLNDE